LVVLHYQGIVCQNLRMNKTDRIDTTSPDMNAELLARLKSVVPQAFSDGQLDLERLAELAGDAVAIGTELWEVALREGFPLIATIAPIGDAKPPIFWRVSDGEQDEAFTICVADHTDLEAVNGLGLPKADLFVCRDTSNNPDWAIVMDMGGGQDRLYLVRETKGSTNPDKLRPDERRKIECGKKHFTDTLGVQYGVVTSVAELPQ
jgi:hypothetical protein